MKKFFVLTLTFSFLKAQFFCTACKSLNSSGYIRERGSLIFQKKIGFGYSLQRRNRFFSNNKETYNYAGWDSESKIVNFYVVYPLKPDLILNFSLPYKEAKSEVKIGPQNIILSAYGVGDLKGGIQKVIFKFPFTFSPYINISFPVGKSNIKKGEVYLSPTMTPGTGSFGFETGTFINFSSPFFSLTSDLKYIDYFKGRIFDIGYSTYTLVDIFKTFNRFYIGTGISYLFHSGDKYKQSELYGTKYSEVFLRILVGIGVFRNLSIDLLYKSFIYGNYSGNSLVPSYTLSAIMEVKI